MEQQDNNKIMTVSFVAVAFIAGIVTRVIFDALAGAFGVIARLHAQEWLSHGLPIGVGVLTFLFLQFNPKVRAWADECLIEVRKVVWPSRKDTTAMTTVVCVMLILAGITIGIFDLVAGNLVQLILS